MRMYRTSTFDYQPSMSTRRINNSHERLLFSIRLLCDCVSFSNYFESDFVSSTVVSSLSSDKHIIHIPFMPWRISFFLHFIKCRLSFDIYHSAMDAMMTATIAIINAKNAITGVVKIRDNFSQKDVNDKQMVVYDLKK